MLLMLLLTTSGCALLSNLLNRNHNNDLAEQHLRLSAAVEEYDKAVHVIVNPDEQVIVTPSGPVTVPPNTRRPGVVTDPQWREFETLVGNVQAANRLVVEDTDKWSTTGSKPADYDAHASALLEARDKVIALVRKVKP
jgi:hypothetical protein